MVIFVRGRIVPEGKNPINRFLIWNLQAGDQGADACQDAAGDPPLARRARRDHLARAPTRHRVHAEPERGHAALHADHLARHLRLRRAN